MWVECKNSLCLCDSQKNTNRKNIYLSGQATSYPHAKKKRETKPPPFPRSCTHQFCPQLTHMMTPSYICCLYSGFQVSTDGEKWKNKYWRQGALPLSSGSKVLVMERNERINTRGGEPCLYLQILRQLPRDNLGNTRSSDLLVSNRWSFFSLTVE